MLIVAWIRRLLPVCCCTSISWSSVSSVVSFAWVSSRLQIAIFSRESGAGKRKKEHDIDCDDEANRNGGKNHVERW